MTIASIHKLGLFHQKLRAATSVYDRLRALEEYEKFMDIVEDELLLNHYKGAAENASSELRPVPGANAG